MPQATTVSSTKRVLLLLVVLAGALAAMSIVQRDRALEREYEDAQERASLYAATVFRNALTSRDLVGPLSGSREEDLAAEVRGFVLTDPAVARVRVWRPDGTLVFSTDAGDESGATSSDPLIAGAADGVADSRLAVELLSPPPAEEGEPEDTPLFQTFAPLRVRGSAEVIGAVEIEQFASALEARADDPWWIVQVAASGAAAFLALLALLAVARGLRRRGRPAARSSDEPRIRRKGRGGWQDDADGGALRERLERATERAKTAEAAAQSFAASLQQATERLEAVERQSPDDRVAELKEALRRSEAERAMLRAGRPETLLEAEVRELRTKLREAQSLAKAAEAVVAGGGDLSAVQEQLSAAARQVDEAAERARIAEGRADAAEDQARAAGDMATAAEQRIDLLEAKLQEIAATGVAVARDDGMEQLLEVRQQLAEARDEATTLRQRLEDSEGRLAAAASLDGSSEELLDALEQRVVAAEQRANEAEERVRAFEDEGGRFRQRLGITAVARKLSNVPKVEEEEEPETHMDLRTAIARGLRAPLTRASGLTLSLQAVTESGEGKAALRQLSASLRRLDQLAADLHDVHRIVDGSLPLKLRRTDLAALLTTLLQESTYLEDRLVRLDADAVSARVDPDRARQIVEGMLDAARDRTRSGASIVVRLRETDAGARVSVEDDNRTPAAVTSEMSLAVRLAELHGTEITVDGSSFRVVFPKGER
jgi:hypothetical protein